MIGVDDDIKRGDMGPQVVSRDSSREYDVRPRLREGGGDGHRFD